jgi:hypothetical protein
MKRIGLSVALLLVACSPPVQPLKGVPTPSRSIPPLQLASGHRKIVFNWEFTDGDSFTRGDGAVRIAAPDSARLDFFVGPLGGAAALVGDTLRARGGDLVRHFIPPVPLMWAALGRMAIPALPETTTVVDGDLLRADIGRPPEWRVSALGDSLVSLDHIPGGKVVEYVHRAANGEVVYDVPSARRRLRLTITRTEETGPFDSSIWNP